ncbi:Glycoside hydrolase family 18 protein [Mycena chlorophos]|uniref:Glycoside hydrolase family 18 protein n=1 Tax=Mycena chlorophos TaxID=658473 RepID=A0A8H6SEA1_MYCCL|nr:Glycoside hydrolase family 18 protein [Mycena chlorophos]
MFPEVKAAGHTTRSTPRPHIVYQFKVDKDGSGVAYSIEKRYSEFLALHSELGIKEFSLPPKRLLVTTFLPWAWADDALITERKAGLANYLANLLKVPQYRHNPAVQAFIGPSLESLSRPPLEFELEDALPSTLSRKTAEDLLELAAATASGPIAAAYYPTWATETNPPSKIDYSKFDILFVAFGIPNSSNGITLDAGTPTMLRTLVAGAKSSGKGTKIVLSVGGWTGSGLFHQIAGSSSNRSKFVANLAALVSEYNLDGASATVPWALSHFNQGIDLDWEYPNSAGSGNPYGSSDSANFLTLLKALRASLGPSKIISATTTDLPWLGSNGSPLKDVSAYANELTMNYDINGSSWSAAPGPNAPLSNACGTSSQPSYTAKAAFKQWTAAGAPASKLLLGLPLYGYVYHSSKTTLAEFAEPTESVDDPLSVPAEPANEKEGQIRGSNRRIAIPEDAEPAADSGEPVEIELPEAAVLPDGLIEPQPEVKMEPEPQTNEEDVSVETTANLSKWWGQAIPFNSLVASGALVKNSSGSYVAGPGYTLVQDQCSDTPFLYSKTQTTVVCYDDTHSLADKAAYALSSGMAGCFTWSLDQDDGVTLQNAIRQALGKST